MARPEDRRPDLRTGVLRPLPRGAARPRRGGVARAAGPRLRYEGGRLRGHGTGGARSRLAPAGAGSGAEQAGGAAAVEAAAVAEGHSLWVRPGRRDHGVARLLIADAVAWAREQGSASLSVWTVATNHRALAVLVRCGFRVTDTHQPHPRDPGIQLRQSSYPFPENRRPLTAAAGKGTAP
ncbi:GNAT family N-acetyltransferase [Streptacidiphilus sp. 4-A2]|nr:GNAT family N-acetyltransferase [Streptacidiphilus sp. 4-A2]